MNLTFDHVHKHFGDLPVVDGFSSEFKTGELGSGHALMFVDDAEACLAFYRGVLGFKRSDWLNIGPGMSGHFLRCTPRHHSVAFIQVGPFAALNHIMVEMTSLDAVGAALDRANRAGLKITRSLGRHLNDKTVSFYMQSPAGWEVEVGWDAVIVDDTTWCDREAAGEEIWGHQGPTPEGMEELTRAAVSSTRR